LVPESQWEIVEEIPTGVDESSALVWMMRLNPMPICIGYQPVAVGIETWYIAIWQ
jgi:hypothetical protein